MYMFMMYVLVVCVSTALVASEKSHSPRPGTPIVNRVKDAEIQKSPRNIDTPVFRKSHGAKPTPVPSRKDLSKSQPPFNAKHTKVEIPHS